MKSPKVRYVTAEPQAPLRFSVCTLVASEAKYRRLLASFARSGFDKTNAEFLAIDNRDENRFDGYRALRAVFPQCRGEFILYTHDDIELVDQGAEDLLRVLRDLEARDPNWTLAGNAGWTTDRPERLVLHLVDPHGDRRDVVEPVRVGGLDENFLVLRRSHMVFPSLDLSGFHLFATDLCEQSRFAGGSAWVIPFFLRHHSGGSPSQAVERICADSHGNTARWRPGRSSAPLRSHCTSAQGGGGSNCGTTRARHFGPQPGSCESAPLFFGTRRR